MIFLYILFGIVALVVILLLIAMTRPAEFAVSRSTSINAPPATVFGLVNDFHQWEEWSPWAKLDPNSKVTYQGNSQGVGAIFTWDGNKKVGAGRMEIVQSDAPKAIKIQLNFLRPFPASNMTHFDFSAQGNQTQVNWKMTGKSPLMFRVMGLFINCDEMVGKDFEKGLAQMKALAETSKAGVA